MLPPIFTAFFTNFQCMRIAFLTVGQLQFYHASIDRNVWLKNVHHYFYSHVKFIGILKKPLQIIKNSKVKSMLRNEKCGNVKQSAFL
jgi:hypothetical protein